MSKKVLPIVNVKLEKIVGGGQTLGTLENGCKIFTWGGLPNENVSVQVTKKKSKMAEGIVIDIISNSPNRVEPLDKESYLSTSPWQIFNFDFEQETKAILIKEAFDLQKLILPNNIEVFSDNKIYNYRNKVEFSWYFDKVSEKLELAFFRRGTHGKIPVENTSLAYPKINTVAIAIRNMLRSKEGVRADMLKTLLIRSSQTGETVAQLYVKDPNFNFISEKEIDSIGISGFELIFSNPQSPASIITKRIMQWGKINLSDKILDIPFTYAVEGFFQINIPVYEQVITDIKKWVTPNKKLIDLYSGVGTIGLTVSNSETKLIEVNKQAYKEMKQNILSLNREKDVEAILESSETALDYITSDAIIIVDPPRAGLHNDVIEKIIESSPERVIYLSCNPITQARDIEKLSEKYYINWHRGYNFFPRTPHIEHLVILDLLNN